MKQYIKLSFCLLGFLICSNVSQAQLGQSKNEFSKADTLRGMLTPLRTCYDINYYHLDVKIDIDNKAIKGSNEFAFTATQNFNKLQFDLFDNLKVEKVVYKGKNLSFTRAFNAVFVNFPKMIKKGSRDKFTVYYSGNPIIAKHAPWDGGFIFTKDKSGNSWASVACQGFGASCWWPTKDHQSDEVDSMLISLSAKSDLQVVSNGRLRKIVAQKNGYNQYNWFVSNPINNYNVTFYIGQYAHWTDQYAGENGNLSLDFWSLKEDSLQAKPHWDADVKPMLKCFEYWFGPYPFYKDGYKLVQAPHLGMEHQSAVAYGNQFKQGYSGRDLSGTGHGLKFDFITVHESGHEWFGNNITSKDLADMWIHESFTNYSETIYTQCTQSKEAANEYVQGTRKNIVNDRPIIASYNVNKEGSGDMYYKGGNMIHTIRQLINDDEKFRQILRGLNKTFYHKTVTTQEIENYIATQSGLKLNKIFDQYLRTTQVPVLEYKIEGNSLKYHWANVEAGFDMPVKFNINNKIVPCTEQWTTITINSNADNFKVDPNFYVNTKKVE